MRVVGIIPARMGSLRFPGKPLAAICGKPMIEHVYRRSALCRSLDRIAVATPDEEIAEVVRGFGGESIITSNRHERATDRVAEAAETTGGDIIIVIQGDEPLLHPEMVDSAWRAVADDELAFCANVVGRIETREEFENPNTIKVTGDHNGNALYFSRSPIPNLHQHRFGDTDVFKQVCIIPFRRDTLRRFQKMEPTSLEKVESIDMLRVLQHGYSVRLVRTEHRTLSVDHPVEIQAVESAMKHDLIAPLY